MPYFVKSLCSECNGLPVLSQCESTKAFLGTSKYKMITFKDARTEKIGQRACSHFLQLTVKFKPTA